MLGHRARVGFREIDTKAMYDKTSPGLETPGTPTVASLTNCPTCNATIEGVDARGPSTHRIDPCGCTLDHTNPTPIADGGTQWTNLSGFQRDLLLEIYRMDTDEPHGLGIQKAISQTLDDDVNHGRLYPNLDTLVELQNHEFDRFVELWAVSPRAQVEGPYAAEAFVSTAHAFETRRLQRITAIESGAIEEVVAMLTTRAELEAHIGGQP
jgi:hypothetical protein